MTCRLHDPFVLDKVDDVLVFANCLYQTGQYHRAIAVVKNRTDVKVCEHHIILNWRSLLCLDDGCIRIFFRLNAGEFYCRPMHLVKQCQNATSG